MKRTTFWRWFLFVAVCLGLILYLAPFYFSFMSAFKTNGEIIRDPAAAPENWLNFDNFFEKYHN